MVRVVGDGRVVHLGLEIDARSVAADKGGLLVIVGVSIRWLEIGPPQQRPGSFKELGLKTYLAQPKIEMTTRFFKVT
jgi:hypothetical protein